MFPAVRAALGSVHNTELQLTSAYVLGRMSCTEMGLVQSLLGCSRTSRKSLTYATATVADSSALSSRRCRLIASIVVCCAKRQNVAVVSSVPKCQKPIPCDVIRRLQLPLRPPHAATHVSRRYLDSSCLASLQRRVWACSNMDPMHQLFVHVHAMKPFCYVILHLDARYRTVVNFTLRPLYPRKTIPGIH